MIGIYRITCLSTGQFYVGASTNIAARLAGHKSILRNGSHHILKMQADFLLHGEEDFVFEAIRECEISQLSVFEQEEINRNLSDGLLYNLTAKSADVWSEMKSVRTSMLRAILSEADCQALDAACIRQSVMAGKIINRSDLVRAWIAAGCPVVPTDPDAAVNRRILDRLASGVVKITPADPEWQSPQPTSAGNAAAPVAIDVGAGWRELELGEIIELSDEYLNRDGQWVPNPGLVAGDGYQPFPTDRGVQHARHRRKLSAADDDWQAGEQDQPEWPDVMGTGGEAPSARIDRIIGSAAANWEEKHHGKPDMGIPTSFEQPAADANAGAAHAPVHPDRIARDKPSEDGVEA